MAEHRDGTEFRLTQTISGSKFDVQLGDLHIARDGPTITVCTGSVVFEMTEDSEIDGSAKRIVLLGPSGCGKGTQASLLCKLLEIDPCHHLSAGDTLRSMIRDAETPAGNEMLAAAGISKTTHIEEDQVIRDDARTLQEIADSRNNSTPPFTGTTSFDWLEYAVANGRLVPDEWTERIIEQVFQARDLQREFILDGYPRTERAAKHFVGLMRKLQIQVDRVLVLHVPDFEVEERLLSRRRGDDRPEAIRARIDFYHRHVERAIHYLQKAVGNGKVHHIGYRPVFDPEGDVDVHASISATFESVRSVFARGCQHIDLRSQTPLAADQFTP